MPCILLRQLSELKKAFQEGVLASPAKEMKGILKKSESQDANEFPDDQGKELKLPVAWEKFQK